MPPGLLCSWRAEPSLAVSTMVAPPMPPPLSAPRTRPCREIDSGGCAVAVPMPVAPTSSARTTRPPRRLMPTPPRRTGTAAARGARSRRWRRRSAAPAPCRPAGRAAPPSVGGSGPARWRRSRTPGSSPGCAGTAPGRPRRSDDLEGVRDPSQGAWRRRRHRQVLCAVEVHQELALEHDHRLVGVRMVVQRRDLALIHPVLEQQERAAGLLGGRLPDVQTAAEEPASLSLVAGIGRGTSGRACVLIGAALVVGLEYHDETDIP